MTYSVGFGLPTDIEDVKTALADLRSGPASILADAQIAALEVIVEKYDEDPNSVGPFRSPCEDQS